MNNRIVFLGKVSVLLLGLSFFIGHTCAYAAQQEIYQLKEILTGSHHGSDKWQEVVVFSSVHADSKGIYLAYSIKSNKGEWEKFVSKAKFSRDIVVLKTGGKFTIILQHTIEEGSANDYEINPRCVFGGNDGNSAFTLTGGKYGWNKKFQKSFGRTNFVHPKDAWNGKNPAAKVAIDTAELVIGKTTQGNKGRSIAVFKLELEARGAWRRKMSYAIEYVYVLASGAKASSPQPDNSKCSSYAKTAVDQNSQNKRQKCGYSGGRWSDNYDGHYDWCVRTGGSSIASEIRTRKELLARCGQAEEKRGIAVDQYCKKIHGNDAYSEHKRNDAFSWRCVNPKNGFRDGVSMEDACRRQYGTNWKAKMFDRQDAYSWKCVKKQ